MTFTKCWCFYNLGIEENQSPTTHEDNKYFVFANRNEEDAIYPLTVKEIARSQSSNKTFDKLTKLEKYKPQLVEDIEVLCKDGKLVIPKDLQHRAVEWYHHYLQHPGHTRLEETLCSAMYWKGMHNTVHSYVKKCHKV